MNAKKREKVRRIKSSERVKERKTGRIGKREKVRNIKSSERVKERDIEESARGRRCGRRRANAITTIDIKW